MDTGSKKNISFAIKWTLFWTIIAFIDIRFNIGLIDAREGTEAYTIGIAGILFTLFKAKFEAIYFHIKSITDYKTKYNEHNILTVIRASFLLVAFYFTDLQTIFCYCLCFPFLHDGFYYYFRNKINPTIYTNGFFSQSNTSTAFFTNYMTPIVRSILFIVGLALLIITNENIFL